MAGKIRNLRVVGTAIKHGKVEDVIVEGLGGAGGAGATGPAGPAGPTGATGSGGGSSGATTLVAYPNTSKFNSSGPLTVATSSDYGEYNSVVWGPVGQVYLDGFWSSTAFQPAATENDGTRITSYIHTIWFNDAIGPTFSQSLTWITAIPMDFISWAGSLSLWHKVTSFTEFSTATFVLTIYHPTTGAFAAEITRTLTGGSSPDASYQALSLSSSTLNGIGFNPGDMIKLVLTLRDLSGDDSYNIRLGKLVFGWNGT